MALAGCVAGGVGGVAGNPADIVLVRMIADRVKPPDQQLGYRNAFVAGAESQSTEALIGSTASTAWPATRGRDHWREA